MSLTVEDGSGITNADSYLGVADATAYHAKYGNEKWTYLPDKQDVALRVATQSIDLVYAPQFPVWERTTYQALRWPRSGFVDNYGNTIDQGKMPQELLDATAEAALLYIEQELIESGTGRSALIRETPDAEANVKSEQVSIDGAVSESKSYFKPVSTTKLRRVGLMLYPILQAQGAAMLIRG